MDIVKRMEIITETTADDFPNASIEAWMGEAAAEIKNLRGALRFALGEAKRTPFNAERYDAAAALLRE